MKARFLNKDYEITVWSNERLGKHIAVDTETTLAPFTETPEMVTFQAFDGDRVFYVRLGDVRKFLGQHAESTLIFHNAAFDIDVICKHLAVSGMMHDQARNYFDPWIRKGTVYDTAILYRLLGLATRGFVPHKYSLALVTQELFGVELDKNEEIRNTFEQYKGQDPIHIPEHYLSYGALDVIATFYGFHSLLSAARSTGSTTDLSHQIQLAGALALNRIYKRGIGFDLERSTAVLNKIYTEMAVHQDILATYGWVRGFKGSKERYEWIVRDYLQLDLPRTEDGSVSSKAEDLEKYKDNHFVNSYLKFIELEKQSTFLRDLKHDTIHPRYNYLLNTGRTSCKNPNFQQLPRDGDIRSCFIAGSGNTFLITDYSTLELCTLAQITYTKYGHSVMRELINEGRDLHRYYASVLHKCKEEHVTKSQRQEAKAANFGFPGGLGIETFIKFSAGYGLTLSPQQAQKMKNAWFRAFPEVKEYLNEQENDEAAWTLTGRKRANASYCARKNTPFQGLSADGCKIALYELDFQGFAIRGFIHDEIVVEVNKDSVEDSKKTVEKIMIDSMKAVCPDVLIKVETIISERFTK